MAGETKTYGATALQAVGDHRAGGVDKTPRATWCKEKME
jgi:hypothetical protein